MLPDFAQGDPLWEAAFGVGIFAIGIVLSLFAEPVIVRVTRRLTKQTKTSLDDHMVEALARPLQLFILAQAAGIALTSTTFLNPWQATVTLGWRVLVVAIGVIAVARLFRGLTRWYGADVASRTKSSLDDRMLPLVNLLFTGLIVGIGLLVIASTLGLKVQPVLAGLDLSGLAIALALQPTLANLISSAWMATDGTATAGDFVEVQNGPSGTVLDIGWRTTRILTPVGNVVMIPNSTLANAIITNYQAVTPEMNAIVACSVSLASDLNRVEGLALDVVKSVIHDLPETVVSKGFTPVVRFREFGEYEVKFNLLARGKDRGSVAAINHEIIKRLHRRFNEAGIEFGMPSRRLHYQGALASGNGKPTEPGALASVHRLRRDQTDPDAEDADV